MSSNDKHKHPKFKLYDRQKQEFIDLGDTAGTHCYSHYVIDAVTGEENIYTRDNL